MGGHGGLNILPQKRWNVYNYDNRAKVERDKRRLHERRNQELESQIKNESTARIQELRENQLNKTQKKEYRDDNQTGKYDQQKGFEKAIERHQQFIQRQEKKETGGDNAIKQNEKKFKEVNLFTAEEDAHNQELQRKMDIQSEKYFEGKPFEMDTKFGGNFKNQPNIPWYAQVNQKPERDIEEEKDKNNLGENKRKGQLQQEINEFRKNTKKDKEFFKVIDDKLLMCHVEDKEDSTKDEIIKGEEKERKHRKNEQDDKEPEKQKKIKKDKKSHKDKHKKDKEKREEQEKMIKLQKLREERLKREQQERLKQRELFRANPND